MSTELAPHHRVRWIYNGIWAILTRCFRVPMEPPTLPVKPGEALRSFRPSPSFLKYHLFQFTIGAGVAGLSTLGGDLALSIASWPWGLALSVPTVLILGTILLISYMAIYLRYDTTWYVLSDRSMRIRRGIWVIHETTITYENIQNVAIRQGPLERWFGFANLMVDTAGAGASGQHPQNQGMVGPHQGLLEGLDNAAEVRDLILSHLKHTKTTGLGDELHPVASAKRASSGAPQWTPEHLVVLREIREQATLLAQAGLGSRLT